MTRGDIWPEADLDRATRLRKAGWSARAISVQLGERYSPGVIMDKLGEGGAVSRFTTVWTPARLERLHELENQGMSNTEIGKAMGLGPGAIAGKLARLGIVGVHRANPAHAAAERKRRRRKEDEEAEARRAAHERDREEACFRAGMGLSCSRPDCTKPKQPGYLDGLCAEHRRDLMPDRTRADMVADTGPVGW